MHKNAIFTFYLKKKKKCVTKQNCDKTKAINVKRLCTKFEVDISNNFQTSKDKKHQEISSNDLCAIFRVFEVIQ